MAVTTFNYDRFEVFTMLANEWRKKHQRTELKYHDPEGFFGAQRYDYFLYVNREEEQSRGSSRPYILLHTKRSLERMRAETKVGVRTSMMKLDINIENVEKEDMVIVACDHRSGSDIGGNAASIFFQKRRDNHA